MVSNYGYIQEHVRYNTISPLLHVFASFPNTNPSLQPHLYWSFFLLQIWLHPPLLAVSHACTKNEKEVYQQWQFYHYGIYLDVYAIIHIWLVYTLLSPLLQAFSSFANTNPTSQEHTYHSFLLVQICLQPPLFSSSQGCTKYLQLENRKHNFFRLLITYIQAHTRKLIS